MLQRPDAVLVLVLDDVQVGQTLRESCDLLASRGECSHVAGEGTGSEGSDAGEHAGCENNQSTNKGIQQRSNGLAIVTCADTKTPI